MFRRKNEPDLAPKDGWFAEWLLRQFSGGGPTSQLPYAELERICANAGSLVLGAAYAAPGRFRGRISPTPALGREADLVARRTADAFKASLADRKNAVIAWPWDHMATAIAWDATRRNDTSEAALGAALLDLGATYTACHREQMAAVLDLWRQVAAGIHATPEPDLMRMGLEMLDAFEAVLAIGGSVSD